MKLLLKVSAVSKAFPGVKALDGVHFDLREGEVHALVGENGAGKSTLIKIITGALKADEGSIEVGGEPFVDVTPARAKERGIAAIYQHPALFADLTVAENIALGRERGGAWRRIDWRGRREKARALLARVGADIDADAPVRTLSMPQQQMVEIARALGAEARILIMDEPTASLPEREVGELFRVIRELHAQGVGILYISHRLEELYQIANRVTVLRDGQSIATRAIGEVDRAALIRMMVGRELSAVFPKREIARGGTTLETKRLSCRSGGVREVSLSVRAGEILGMFGLVGAGRTELARTLFGLTPADGGEILLKGRKVTVGSPAEAVAAGIAYVPEDRRHHGVIAEMPVAANTSLAILGQPSGLAREKELALDYVRRFRIRTPSLYAPVGNLSGGNQQKVLLARWLATHPSVLILDEPTQGIDVGARAEIYTLMGEMAESGMAIVMISSELPEILGMSDRIAVFRGGAIVGMLERSEATQEKVLALALGHEVPEPNPMSSV